MGFRCVGCGAWVNRHKCEYCGNEYDDKGRIDNREKCVAGDRTVIARVDKFQPYTEITINEKGVRVATRRMGFLRTRNLLILWVFGFVR